MSVYVSNDYTQPNYQSQLLSALAQSAGILHSGQIISGSSIDQMVDKKVDEIIKYEQKETKMFQPLKDYINKNREILFTVGFILLLDHFVFKGAMKNKIQELLEGVISKVKNAGGKNEQE